MKNVHIYLSGESYYNRVPDLYFEDVEEGTEENGFIIIVIGSTQTCINSRNIFAVEFEDVDPSDEFLNDKG